MASMHHSHDGFVEVRKEARLTKHVRAVLGVLLAGLATAAIGSWLHLVGTLSGGTLWTIFQIVALLALGVSQFAPRDEGVSKWRFAAFTAFAFSAGVNVGTWIDYANAAAHMPQCDWANTSLTKGLSLAALRDPLSLPPCTLITGLLCVAFTLAAAVYACFFFAALYAKPGQYLFLGAYINLFFLAVALAGLVHWLGLLNAHFIEFLYLQGALVAYSLTVLYETSKLAAKAESGEPLDVVSDAIHMLGNFLNILVRVLVLLAKATGEAQRRRQEDERRRKRD